MATRERSKSTASARSSRTARDARGFSLIEVLVSVGILALASLSVAQLFTVATSANFASKSQTSTALLAVQKMEQLKALTWGFDQSSSNLGLPVSDTATDLSQPAPAGGGQGLNPSPAGTLDANVAGAWGGRAVATTSCTTMGFGCRTTIGLPSLRKSTAFLLGTHHLARFLIFRRKIVVSN